MTPTITEIRKVLVAVEVLGPFQFEDRTPVTVTREQLRVLCEAARTATEGDPRKDRHIEALESAIMEAKDILERAV